MTQTTNNLLSTFLKECIERGLMYQCTNLEEVDRLFATDVVTAYVGFDCTADALHVGHLIQIMILRLLQKHGHKVIVLVGGGTTRVGDPSFKDKSRKMIDLEEIEHNKSAIKQALSHYIDFSNGRAEMIDNADWLTKLNYLEFLRDYGQHFSVNKMMSAESVKMRLEREQNLSFLEFNYMLLQAYDFLFLHQNKNCMLQIGGSDQWVNITTGIDLIRPYA